MSDLKKTLDELSKAATHGNDTDPPARMWVDPDSYAEHVPPRRGFPDYVRGDLFDALVAAVREAIEGPASLTDHEQLADNEARHAHREQLAREYQVGELVAAAYEDAAHKVLLDNFETAEEAAEQIRALTPSDARAALAERDRKTSSAEIAAAYQAAADRLRMEYGTFIGRRVIDVIERLTPDDAREALEKIKVEAASRAPSVAVKPLDWRRKPRGNGSAHAREELCAETPFGDLVVKDHRPFLGWPAFSFGYGDYVVGKGYAFCASEDAAKAAAQDDYERRIRSAIAASRADAGASFNLPDMTGEFLPAPWSRDDGGEA